MGLNTRFKQSPTATAAELVITWLANEPTPGSTATIFDGDIPTVNELGQAVADLTRIVNQLIDDNASLRNAIND